MVYELGATSLPECLGDIVYGYDVSDTDAETTIVIPNSGAAKVRLTTKPIYSDDNITVRHYEYTLNVETTIAAHTTAVGHNANNDPEQEIGRFRQILSTPGLQLQIYPRGVGSMPLVFGPDYSPTLTPSLGQFLDVTGGPFPQEVMVEPVIGNQAIYIKWTVVFNIPHCNLNTYLETETVITEYTLESDYEVDDEGDLVFTLTGTLVFARPQTTTVEMARASNLVDRLAQRAGTNAPYTGYKKSQRVSHSRDKRTFKFNIKYTQIKSDSAFPLLTRNISGKDSMSTNMFGNKMIGTGFYSWLREIDVSISLPANVLKDEAWNIFLDILSQRFHKMYPASKAAKLIKGKVPVDPTPQNENTPWFLPLSLTITNQLYTRNMDFRASFLMMDSLQNILTNSKIFSRIHNSFIRNNNDEIVEPSSRSYQWAYWDTSSATRDIGGKYRTYSENIPIEINTCDAYDGEMFAPNIPYPGPTIYPNDSPGNEMDPHWGRNTDPPSPPEPYPETSRESQYPPEYEYDTISVPPRHSYVDYKCNFELVEDNKTQVLDFLEPYTASRYSNNHTTLDRGNSTDFTVNGLNATNRGDYSDQTSTPPVRDLLSRGAPRYYIRMTGYAIRVAYPASAPVITEVGGQTAYRYGIARTKVTNIEASPEYPIYLTTWDIMYTINGHPLQASQTDILKTIAGNFEPALYT